MKLIIGLGNPGKQYQMTRHNIGFMMVDTLFADWKEEKKFKSLVSTDFQEMILSGGASGGQHQGSPVLGIKPQTFMNLSGEAVSTLVSFYKLDPKKDILVISDDIDMEFGKVRLRSEGSHGGQNGLRDIIARLGTNEFARIKIGIGRNDLYEVSDWVLSSLSDNEQKILETETRVRVEEYIKKWLGD